MYEKQQQQRRRKLNIELNRDILDCKLEEPVKEVSSQSLQKRLRQKMSVDEAMQITEQSRKAEQDSSDLKTEDDSKTAYASDAGICHSTIVGSGQSANAGIRNKAIGVSGHSAILSYRK